MKYARFNMFWSFPHTALYVYNFGGNIFPETYTYVWTDVPWMSIVWWLVSSTDTENIHKDRSPLSNPIAPRRELILIYRVAISGNKIYSLLRHNIYKIYIYLALRANRRAQVSDSRLGSYLLFKVVNKYRVWCTSFA